MNFAQPFQDYELLDRVGAGAMGTVFKARHKKLGRIVALKVLKPSLARDARYVDRLRREARIVAALNHPNIVTGYDLGEEGGYHFFVMEFVEGKSLRALLVEWGMFAEEYVLKVGQQVAAALDHAYQRGVIHRDVKPGNILIDEQGNVKLTDLGLAKGPADLTLTRDGATVGTPQYISPEQARNPQDVDVRSDLYSLGATLYHMATGQPPFRGDTMAELITKVLQATPVPPDQLNPALSPGLSLVLRKLLAKDLRLRYQTPRELLDDLDRVQRSLPPAVDAARLESDRGERPRLWLRAGLAVGLATLLGAAVWVGMQLREDAVAAVGADEFFAALDRDLAALPTPGERWLRLRAALATPPAGAELGLLQRERLCTTELQAAVDEVALAFGESGWAGLAKWLQDPTEWPDRGRCERERIVPRLRERCGLLPAQLPGSVVLRRLDELHAAIDRLLAERDAELLRRVDAWLQNQAPASAEERLRAGDFAGAERVWQHAEANCLDGARLPLPERLVEPLRREVRARCERAVAAALPAIDAAEAAVATALREEAAQVVADLGDRLLQGGEPEVVAQALQTLRQDLLQVWPASARFRLGRDPWPEIERQFGALQQRLAVAGLELQHRRFAQRLDLAWRAFCHGSPAAGLRLLAETGGSPAQAAQLAQHRQALQAAQAVHDAVLAAIARSAAPVLALPRQGGDATDLRVAATPAGLRLLAQAPGQPPRPAALVEFRFTELLQRLGQGGGDPLGGVPAAERRLGALLLALAGDDLLGLEARLAADGQGFVVDEVWPRLLRVRGERAEAAVDLAELYDRLQAALAAAEAGGPLRDLEAALRNCQARGEDLATTDRQRGLLRQARERFALLQRAAAAARELAAAAPSGAAVEARVAQGAVVATVALPAAVLHRDAGEGWQLRDGAVEFAGGQRPWAELPLQALRGATGLGGDLGATALELDLVLPPAAVGRRLYVVEFRGLAAVLALGSSDAVHAAVVDGDPRREEAAQRAFTRALAGALAAPKALAVPGAVHRLRIEVAPSPSRRRAAVRIEFDGRLLCEESRDLDPDAAPAVALLPGQELSVKALRVRAALR